MQGHDWIDITGSLFHCDSFVVAGVCTQLSRLSSTAVGKVLSALESQMCAAVSAGVPSIATTYRMTGRPPPTKPSPFLPKVSTCHSCAYYGNSTICLYWLLFSLRFRPCCAACSICLSYSDNRNSHSRILPLSHHCACCVPVMLISPHFLQILRPLQEFVRDQGERLLAIGPRHHIRILSLTLRRRAVRFRPTVSD